MTRLSRVLDSIHSMLSLDFLYIMPPDTAGTKKSMSATNIFTLSDGRASGAIRNGSEKDTN